MERLNRDAVIAMVLLVFCGVFFWATFDIRQPDYGVLMPSTWPRVVLGVLALLSMIYLIQSLRQEPEETDKNDEAPPGGGIKGWISHWRNPLWCVGLFFTYLATLPVLAMLIGGVSFVFALQGRLGAWGGRELGFRPPAPSAPGRSGLPLFTFGLGVILPSGMFMDPM